MAGITDIGGLMGGFQQRIRSLLSQDKERAVLRMAKGNTSSMAPGSSYDMLQSYGYDTVADYLRLEQDLLSRYVDYESMDDYDLINTILDLYADDATQPDTPTGRRVWAVSADKDLEQLLNDFLHRTLRIDEEIWEIARLTCKYGNCVRRGSRVWTEFGSRAIETVESGDRVWGYKEGHLRLFTVVKRHCNGVKRTYRVRTRHREVCVTENHPLLIQKSDGTTQWVEVRDLEVLRWKPSSGRSKGGLRPDNPKLVVGLRSPAPKSVTTWEELFEVPVEECPWGKGSPTPLLLPERIAPWFCRLLGFLWGDGSVYSTERSVRAGVISFARSNHEDRNEYYSSLLIDLGLRVSITEDGSSSYTNSILFMDVLLRLGWVNGASKKRLPRWLGKLPDAYREAFLKGFMDADGWSSEPRTRPGKAWHFEIANVPLAYDLKALIDGLGYRSGNVRERHRPPGFKICGRVVKTTQPTGMLTFSYTSYSEVFAAENLLEVCFMDETEVFDLEVDDVAHNFVVEGVVVHNSMEEIVVGEEGVVALNPLQTHTVRRIEGPRGELYGFVQDFNRRIGYSPREFQALMAKRLKGIGGSPLNPNAGSMRSVDIKDVVPFESWQVAHFRIRSKQRKSTYGYCLAGESRVWTTRGLKAIEDIQVGDQVFYQKASKTLRTSPVLNQVCSGTKPLLSLKTAHREVRLTAEHPVLRWRDDIRNHWVGAGELKAGDRICIATNMPQMHGSQAFGLLLQQEHEDSLVRVTERGAAALQERTRMVAYAPKNEGLRAVAAGVGISRHLLDDLLVGRSSLSRNKAKELFEAAALPFFEGATKLAKDSRLDLPDFVTPTVARLFGFLLGDGWITEGQVYFARSRGHEDRNLFYEQILEGFGLPVSRLQSDAEMVERTAYVSSKGLVSLFQSLGWIGGAHNKRVPAWVHGSSREIREAFLQGFQDADGWITTQDTVPKLHFEICNEALLRDLKNIIDGLGWTSGNIRTRAPRTSEYKGKEIRSGTGYLLTYHKTLLADGDFVFERVKSIESAGEGPVYDIEIAAEGHNFVAEGVLVHNSVLESARWTFKRLVLLEDAALIYRLQRAPERYAFYVDVGNKNPREAFALMNKLRQQHKKKRYVNPSTGMLDMKYATLPQDSDFFVPVVNGAESTRIDVLGGPNWQHMDDIEYFLRKLFSALKVPRAYLSHEEGVNRAILSSQDVHFARTILRIQQVLRSGLEKVCRVHLAALNIPPDKVEFDLRFTVPSAIFELAQLEVRNARADYATRMREVVSLRWILAEVMGMPNDEVERVLEERDEEVVRMQRAAGKGEAAMQKEMQAMGVGGGDDKGGGNFESVNLERVRKSVAKPSSRRLTENLQGFSREDRNLLRMAHDNSIMSNRNIKRLQGLVKEVSSASRNSGGGRGRRR